MYIIPSDIYPIEMVNAYLQKHDDPPDVITSLFKKLLEHVDPIRQSGAIEQILENSQASKTIFKIFPYTKHDPDEALELEGNISNRRTDNKQNIQIKFDIPKNIVRNLTIYIYLYGFLYVYISIDVYISISIYLSIYLSICEYYYLYIYIYAHHYIAIYMYI